LAYQSNLSGRVAVVTGAGSGIGKAAALYLRDLGAHVIATDINEGSIAQTMEELGSPESVGLHHDVTSAEDWDRVISVATERFDRLDILVNNAGIMLPGKFGVASVDHLRIQYKVNVESVYLGMYAALPALRKSIVSHSSKPSIVNVSSIYGQVAGAQYAAYSASKGAVRMLTKAVAFELAPEGIRVNSIHPGPTATNLSSSWEPARDASGRLIDPEVALAKWLTLIPMGRLGSVDDIAPVIAFLAGDCAAFVTGAEFIVDGGYTTA
jgi:NAD(P)-dependent dehydrogenase (short-subunit alcohol dehydrogenase family)